MKPFIKRKTATSSGDRRRLSYHHIVFFTLILFNILSCAFTQTFEFPPTTFTQQPLAGSPEVQNNTKVLLCLASGLPKPVYRWQKDGTFTTSSNTTANSLRIAKVQLKDAGMYQCVASNAHGALLSNRVYIHVAYMVPFKRVASEVTEVNEGDACVLDLPPLDSYPAPIMQWYEGSERPVRTQTQRLHVTLDHQLVILETRTDDNKRFSVTAVNSYIAGDRGQTRHSFTIRVNAMSSTTEIPPVIVIPPSPTTAVQGSDSAAILECVANARSLSYLTLKWYRVNSATEKVEIKNGQSKYRLSMYRRKLFIKNPTTSDTGTYLCEATFNKPDNSFSYPAATASANLTVYVKPSFVSLPPPELSPDYGSSATIPCNAIGIPNLTYKWYRNTVEVDVSPDSRYQLEETGSLRVEGIKPDDAGMFQCFVSNEAGEINSATWLKVTSSPPEIRKKPQNLSVIAGQSARFLCEVSGAPQPVVTWYKGTGSGAMQPLATSTRVQVLQSELLIAMTEISDAGNYTCNVSNTIGVATASAYLRVTLRTTITMPPKDASVIKGSTKTLQCQVSHDASVTVTWVWYHNNRTISASDRRRQMNMDGSLRITSVRNQDVGTYRCQVTSVGGNDSASAAIEIIELPYSPSVTSVELSTDSNRAVIVAWQPGYDGKSPISRFVVQYRQLSPGVTLRPEEGWRTASASVSKDSRLYTVTGLRPAQRYQFRVSAVNDVGQGPASGASSVVTLPQQPPSGPPLEVVASPRLDTASSVIIQWKPPLEDDWNGALLGYMIRYKLSGYQDNTLSYVNVTNYLVTSFRLDDLIIFQEYEVAVAAYNAKGIGVYSNYEAVRTREGRPEAAPTDLTLTPVNSTAIKLNWKPPKPGFINGINQGYKIEAVRPGVADSRMLCFTSQGNGPKTEVVESRTLEDVPEQVGSLRFEDVLDKTFIALWTPPARINGILRGYELSYMKKGQLITKVTKSVSTLNYTVTGLTATTTYMVEIVALTAMGRGPALTKDVVTGVPPVPPDPPYRLAITNTQSTSVLLQFTPGGGRSRPHHSVDHRVAERPERKPSEPTLLFQTMQAPPAGPPDDITVRAVNETALHVGWTPLLKERWYGEGREYRLQYRPYIVGSDWRTITVRDENANSYTLTALEEWTRYDVRVAAYNKVGISSYSAIITDRTRESGQYLLALLRAFSLHGRAKASNNSFILDKILGLHFHLNTFPFKFSICPVGSMSMPVL
ncbi:Protein sidekick [Lamellibrachia satsuma]|nr:Protein sidekick [Lamellibrachia satsuma]